MAVHPPAWTSLRSNLFFFPCIPEHAFDLNSKVLLFVVTPLDRYMKPLNEPVISFIVTNVQKSEW